MKSRCLVTVRLSSWKAKVSFSTIADASIFDCETGARASPTQQKSATFGGFISTAGFINGHALSPAPRVPRTRAVRGNDGGMRLGHIGIGDQQGSMRREASGDQVTERPQRTGIDHDVERCKRVAHLLG